MGGRKQKRKKKANGREERRTNREESYLHQRIIKTNEHNCLILCEDCGSERVSDIPKITQQVKWREEGKEEIIRLIAEEGKGGRRQVSKDTNWRRSTEEGTKYLLERRENV